VDGFADLCLFQGVFTGYYAKIIFVARPVECASIYYYSGFLMLIPGRKDYKEKV